MAGLVGVGGAHLRPPAVARAFSTLPFLPHPIIYYPPILVRNLLAVARLAILYKSCIAANHPESVSTPPIPIFCSPLSLADVELDLEGFEAKLDLGDPASLSAR